jgi:hypothetical protein
MSRRYYEDSRRSRRLRGDIKRSRRYSDSRSCRDNSRRRRDSSR